MRDAIGGFAERLAGDFLHPSAGGWSKERVLDKIAADSVDMMILRKVWQQITAVISPEEARKRIITKTIQRIGNSDIKEQVLIDMLAGYDSLKFLVDDINDNRSKGNRVEQSM